MTVILNTEEGNNDFVHKIDILNKIKSKIDFVNK